MTYNKALVPVLVALLLSVLGYFGLTQDMTLNDALTFLVTSGLVWLVPNRT